MINELKARVKNGVIPAMATPLNDDQTINLQALEQLITFLVDAGVKGLFVGGSTGEGILLNRNQRLALHERSINIVSGQIPVLVHVGSNTTSLTLELVHHAAAIGADAVVAVTPYFYPMNDQALMDYYSEIAATAAPIPLLAYDIPQMAVNGISPALVTKMKNGIENFGGFKTSRPDAQVIRQLLDAAEDQLLVLAGNERIALGSLALGADGLISGLSTAVPEPFVQMVSAFSRGNIAVAQDYQRKINKLIDMLPAGARIGAIKKLLKDRGIDAGSPVPPRPVAEPEWPGWSVMEALID